MLQFRKHMAQWKEFELDQLNPAIKKPVLYFVFYSIAGDHRREACSRLFDNGYAEYDIPARQPLFATNLSNCMFYLRPKQAKEIGRLDNADKTKRVPDAIDCIFLAEDHIKKLTVSYVVQNTERFSAAAAILKQLTLAELRNIPDYQNACTDDSLEFPVLGAIGHVCLFDPETGKLFAPLAKTMNVIDIREMVYDSVMTDEKHPLLADVHGNAKTKRAWRYAGLMAQYGTAVTATLKEIDEMLKNGSITFTSSDPDK